MENKMQIFRNEEFGQLRMVEINGEIYFVGKDVAEILGYSNYRDALARHIDAEDKRVSRFPTASGEQEMTVINESGLYSLILSSKLPKAKEFKHWVTAEVLPSIRKHGAYMRGKTFEEILKSPAHLMKMLQNWQEDREKLQRAENLIEEQKPKVIFADAVSASQNSILVGELAKLAKQNGINIGQNRLFVWLRENGYLIKGSRADWNMPTQKSMELGLFEVKERTINNPDGSNIIKRTAKVTGKGQIYLVNKLMKVFGR